MEHVATLEVNERSDSHPMILYGNALYVVDGNKILKMELPVYTVWDRIRAFLGVKKKQAPQQ